VQAIADAVAQVISSHPDEANRFKAGEKKLLGFFLGQVMRSFSGRADPQQVRSQLESQLLDE